MSGKFALIIGNTEYTDPGLAQLTAPGKDAEDFARVLKDQEICAFNEVNILLNQPEYIVREAIDEFFDQKKPDDLLVLYFSGHGVRDELGALYLAVKNTNRFRLHSTALKSDFIREAMDQSRSKRQVLIMDCCNSGAFAQGTKAATGVSIGTATAFEAGYGRVILTASDSTQFAWEGDKVIGDTDNSLFTHFLVEGLDGEADLDGDGHITVDELYDYAYEKVKLATPKQTPSKFSSKQQGEIVLRQSMRIEDIKPVTLPDELIEATEDSRTFVREGAVQQLEKLLKGRNLGLARSAREVLERIEREDDSRRVSQAATQVLEPIRQAEKAEEERKAREEAERIAAQKAEEEQIALEKAEAERKAKKEAKRIATLKAKEERLAREKAEAERKAKQEVERLLVEQKAEEERRAKEEAERSAMLKAEEERLAREKAEAEQRAEEQRIAEEKQRAEANSQAERRAKEETEQLLIQQKAEEERKAKEEAEELLRAQAEREATKIDTVTSTPKWSSVFWITLGWAIGRAIDWAISVTVNWAISGAIGGIIGGLVVAITLRSEHILSTRKSILWITLGWAISVSIYSAIGGAIDELIYGTPSRVISWAILGAVGGAIGGVITATALRLEQILFTRKSMLWITLGWAISGAIGEVVAETMTLPPAISGAILGIIVGAIGGFVMIWHIRKEISNR